jgi:clan AA aspartic protease
VTEGFVQDLQARVNVVLRLPGRPHLVVEGVVDTGFAGALTLSPAVIGALGLPFFQEIEANLADDSDVKSAVHIATIIWEGQELEVAVLAMGRRPLLGTALLNGKRLCADFVDDGEVVVKPVPQRKVRQRRT